MAYAKIIRIEYNGSQSPGFTKVSYQSTFAATGVLLNAKMLGNLSDIDDGEVRKYDLFTARLDQGETIRLVSEVGDSNTKTTSVTYYLFTPSDTDDPGIKQWLDYVREEYDAIATDSEEGPSDCIYNKRWPGTEDLGCPRGFEHTMRRW